MLRLAVLAALCLSPAAATADTESDSHTVRLIESGDWFVERHDLGGGNLVCTLVGGNAEGQSVGLRYWRGVELTLQMTFDPTLYDRIFPDSTSDDVFAKTTLVVDVDYDRYIFPARRRGPSLIEVTFPATTGPDNRALTTHMAEGNAIALKDVRTDRTLQTWSLAGSSDAVGTWRACLQDITGPLRRDSTAPGSTPGETSNFVRDYYRSRSDD